MSEQRYVDKALINGEWLPIRDAAAQAAINEISEQSQEHDEKLAGIDEAVSALQTENAAQEQAITQSTNRDIAQDAKDVEHDAALSELKEAAKAHETFLNVLRVADVEHRHELDDIKETLINDKDENLELIAELGDRIDELSATQNGNAENFNKAIDEIKAINTVQTRQINAANAGIAEMRTYKSGSWQVDENGFRSVKLEASSNASGRYIVTEGYDNEATGVATHVAGSHNVSSGNNQLVIGEYNADDTGKVFIIGNGADDENRSNAFTVDRSGNVIVPSVTYVDGNTKVMVIPKALDKHAPYGVDIINLSTVIEQIKANELSSEQLQQLDIYLNVLYSTVQAMLRDHEERLISLESGLN